ncbi:MAG: hypothetical protein NTY22_06745 [Proteobacteria bacterium]|nr:hypothetical protein [Pseudomonadota bacterium]
MKLYEIDFHYYFVEDAINITESIINYARLNDERVECRFITGRGKIQKELIRLLKDTYDLNPVIPMSNGGMVLVEIY